MKFVFILSLLFIVSCNNSPKTIAKNQTIITKADLGKKLFFDPISYLDNSISCASCHKPEFEFADKNIPFQ